MRQRVLCWMIVGFVLLVGMIGAYGATYRTAAAVFADPAFTRTWLRTDGPVSGGAVARTWIWGPEPRTSALAEPYREAPGGTRLVQYFDKSRMELTNPQGNPADPFYVTNGLLATEMLTGNVQLGDAFFEAHTPAAVTVAGDLDDPTGPTYAAFSPLRNAPALAAGTPITAVVNRDGQVTEDPARAGKATAQQYVLETKHTVADVFWNFMTSSGIVDGGATEPLFRSPFYATGFPVTEAYWSVVHVGGQERAVLIQVFERRTLTFTPGNPPGFAVEAGNVGLQYRAWRAFLAIPPTPTPRPTPPPPTATPAPSATPVAATPTPLAETPTLAALIVEVAYDGDAASNDPNDETVVIVNGSSTALDMMGWTLRDTRGHAYTFGAFTLPPDGELTLATGKGTDSPTKRYWGQSSGILDNTGPETISLRDASGILIDTYPYP
ncbi:MAG: lamin tail domain-containing protein [Chloroflexota bacterium]|nr:lamin tail domain-containing protein [Chloroflexota bacterium]